MNLLPLNQNPFARDTLKHYEGWWSKFGDLFTNQTVGKDNSPLVQREFAQNSSHWIKSNYPLDSIPYIEITPLYREVDGGVLFVNCNPSGTDYDYYRDYYDQHNRIPVDSIYYDNPKNTYFDAVEKFVKEGIGVSANYAMIDVFPLVIQNQAVLKKAFREAYSDHDNREEAFNEILESFLEHIVKIKPAVIIATNAFVKDIFTHDNSPFLNLKIKYTISEDPYNVCYHISIDGFHTTLFCSGMISGGHQMDTESKKRLIRDVRHFFSEQRGFSR